MARPLTTTGRRLGDIPFRAFIFFFRTIERLSILFDRKEDDRPECRELMRKMGFDETRVTCWDDRYRRPSIEAFNRWEGSIQDLYRILQDLEQRRALAALHYALQLVSSDRNNGAYKEEDIEWERSWSDEEWEALLNSTHYAIGPVVSWPNFFIMNTGSISVLNYAVDILSNLLPFASARDGSMLTTIGTLFNNIYVFIWCITAVQIAWSFYAYGELNDVIPIVISFSLWLKVYLIRDPIDQLSSLLARPQHSNTQQDLREADFLCRNIRTCLLFALGFKFIIVVMVGVAFLCSLPRFSVDDFTNEWTFIVLILFAFEILHNMFFIFSFYREPSVELLIKFRFGRNARRGSTD